MPIENEPGRYRLQERLTPEGNSWVAEDLEEPGTQVVIKFLPEGADAIAARHAVESLADLKRPGLALPVDEGEMPDGRAYLVYSWVPGHSLRELLNETGPLPFARAGSLIAQIGAAVAALHERGAVHGAISPEHIVVHHAHGHDTATLLHAGMFRVTGETSSSPAYLAPEQLAGNASPATDTWSVAAVAAEMLTGRRAFRYGSLSELNHLQRKGIMRGAFRKIRPKLPLRVEDELRRALSWDAAQRPSDVGVLTGRLAELLGSHSGLPKRRLFILGGLGLAAIAVGVRNCRRRWGM
jgi:eukaryotic-like serine/threonine-protein kinase